jgi:hypothetical protein
MTYSPILENIDKLIEETLLSAGFKEAGQALSAGAKRTLHDINIASSFKGKVREVFNALNPFHSVNKGADYLEALMQAKKELPFIIHQAHHLTPAELEEYGRKILKVNDTGLDEAHLRELFFRGEIADKLKNFHFPDELMKDANFMQNLVNMSPEEVAKITEPGVMSKVYHAGRELFYAPKAAGGYGVYKGVKKGYDTIKSPDSSDPSTTAPVSTPTPVQEPIQPQNPPAIVPNISEPQLHQITTDVVHQHSMNPIIPLAGGVAAGLAPLAAYQLYKMYKNRSQPAPAMIRKNIVNKRKKR